jgi:hypothetical protein
MKIEIIKDPNGNPSGWMFYCPACEDEHIYPMNQGWSFNQNYSYPTFSPSLLLKWDYTAGKATKICHLFVTAGKIKYCGDCTHIMAGQTVDMRDW